MKRLALFLLLAVAASATPSHRHKSKQTQPDPARTTQIQEALVREGKLPAVTGKWDRPTQDALAAMAREHGWSTCHVPDARVLVLLGLGSSTAGAATPTVAEHSRLADNQAIYEREHPETCYDHGN